MFNIGEFSKVAGMTVKTLRFYHEEGLLIPSFVDQQSGYRYYNADQIETARTIAYLRSLEFPISGIKEILRLQGNDEILDIIVRQRGVLQERIKNLRKAVRSLDQFISEEREAIAMNPAQSEVIEKTVEPMLIAAIRMKARYNESGKSFGRIGKALGRYIVGKPLLLHFDEEYKEDDADFEAAMPIRVSKSVDGIAVRQLPGCRCVSLIHKGPYDQMGRSYAKILKYVKEKNFRIVMPTREVYLKGPGMIFKGNPRNYLTEIQIPVE